MTEKRTGIYPFPMQRMMKFTSCKHVSVPRIPKDREMVSEPGPVDHERDGNGKTSENEEWTVKEDMSRLGDQSVFE
jgi:hypothetical protein